MPDNLMKIQDLPGAAFLAYPDMTGMLQTEFSGRLHFNSKPAAVYGELLYYSDFPVDSVKTPDDLPYWARSAMLKPRILDFESIGEAANSLKNIQRNWAPYQYQYFRRANLIQEKLPYINLKPRSFPVKIPAKPIGLYTLISEKQMIFSAETSSFLPAGKITFLEDHENPPSRAR